MHSLCGIDYSLTSPALCCHVGKEWKYENCIFYYLSDKKKYCGVFDKRIYGKSFDDYNTPEQRYDSISSWAFDTCSFCSYV